jgi:branched-chain amino acid transport system permease protein
MVIRVNTIENVVEWRWERMFFIGVGIFILSFVWRYLIKRKELGIKKAEAGDIGKVPLGQRIFEERRVYIPTLIVIAVFVIAFPFTFSMYQTTIMLTALIYIMCGLGLNIVVLCSSQLPFWR